MRRALWSLPPGVSQGTWESFERQDWAREEENWLKGTPLIELDQAFIREQIPSPRGRIVDLGCGAGRVSLGLARRGFDVLAIDLSATMLDQVREKAEQEKLRVECLQANLVELGAIASGSCADAVCLFSTLGMIRGAEHRAKAMAEFYRILAPGGRLLLHAHQFWWNLRQYGGASWVAQHLLDAVVLRRVELGDRFATYRGVPNFYLHSFRGSELRGLLRRAGFEISVWRPLTGSGGAYLQWPRWLPALRGGGWLMAATKK
jgi:ubiquinone/menaquinone biosynthesis C-methylase UbiE